MSQWDDLSGNGHHFTASGTARPTTGTRTINSLNGLDFDGGTDTMTVPAWFPSTGSGAFTVFVALNRDVSASFRPLIGWGGGTSTNLWWYLGVSNAGVADAGFNIYFASVVPGTGWPTGAASLACAQYTGGAGNVSVRQNQASWVPATSRTLNLSSIQPCTLGNPGWSGNFYDGIVGEVIIYTSSLSTGDRDLVEAYLKAKWGTP